MNISYTASREGPSGIKSSELHVFSGRYIPAILVSRYKIDGKSLRDYIDAITIEEYVALLDA